MKFTVFHLQDTRPPIVRTIAPNPLLLNVARGDRTLAARLLDPKSGLYAEYLQVAEVECESLPQVFELTNTIERPWWLNPEVKVAQLPSEPGQEPRPVGFRSTSVGDVVRDESGTLWFCAPIGWEPLSPASA